MIKYKYNNERINKIQYKDIIQYMYNRQLFKYKIESYKRIQLENKIRLEKEDGKSITGSSIINIILGILFEGFLNSILSVSVLKSEGRCPFSTMKFL